jgi:hypothetical protein
MRLYGVPITASSLAMTMSAHSDHRLGGPPDRHELLRRTGLTGADHGEVLAGVPAPVGVHRLAPLLEAVAEVVATGERPAGSAQDDDLDRRIPLGEADGGLDLVGHRRNDRVELVGAVQRDRRNRTGRGVQQCLEFGCRHR